MRVANVADHLIEVRQRGFARDRRQLADRFRVPIAPRFEDRREGLARHPQGVDNDVADGDFLEAQRGKNAEDVATDEQIGPGCNSIDLIMILGK